MFVVGDVVFVVGDVVFVVALKRRPCSPIFMLHPPVYKTTQGKSQSLSLQAVFELARSGIISHSHS